jgi:hypothetical protein
LTEKIQFEVKKNQFFEEKNLQKAIFSEINFFYRRYHRFSFFQKVAISKSESWLQTSPGAK